MFGGDIAPVNLAQMLPFREEATTPQTTGMVAEVAGSANGQNAGARQFSSGFGGSDTGSGQNAASAAGLTDAEQEAVDELQARDREVRDHEQAHARVGGQYAGEPSYTYQTGPDNKQYAVGGEVPIDVAPIDGDPEATIEKMEIVKAAALAPAEPSGQDRKVAALADAQRLAAMAELMSLQNQPPGSEAIGQIYAQIQSVDTEPTINVWA